MIENQNNKGCNDMIKTVDFFGIPVTRLILGDNTFTGHSYITEVHSGEEMMNYYTAEKCVETLFEAEANGLNTYLALADQFILRVLRQYRNEGGEMNIIFQSYPALDLEVNLWQMMACDPIAIYHQGGSADLLIEEGNAEELQRRLELIRKAGVKVGVGTHETENLLRYETENWDVDFYLSCVYNFRRAQRGQKSGYITGKPKDVVFDAGDPPLMYNAIRAVKKPCIAYKLFAGGQVFLEKSQDEIPAIAEQVIREAFDNIKPHDIICIAAFQKLKNQIKENADIVKKVLC